MELTSTPRSPPGQLRQNFHNFTTFEKSEKNEKNELELTSELTSPPTKVLHSVKGYLNLSRVNSNHRFVYLLHVFAMLRFFSPI